MDCGVYVAVQGQEISCSSSLIAIRRMNNFDDFASTLGRSWLYFKHIISLMSMMEPCSLAVIGIYMIVVDSRSNYPRQVCPPAVPSYENHLDAHICRFASILDGVSRAHVPISCNLYPTWSRLSCYRIDCACMGPFVSIKLLPISCQGKCTSNSDEWKLCF